MSAISPEPASLQPELTFHTPEPPHGMQESKLSSTLTDFPCYLYVNVLVQGRLTITLDCVTFLAHLPSDPESYFICGNLSRRRSRSSTYKRYWFSLREDAVSYFSTASHLYSPSGTIPLKNATRAGLADTCCDFFLETETSYHRFKADTKAEATEWVKKLQRAIFYARNSGNRVQIEIPVRNILDVEHWPHARLNHILRIVALNKDFSLDDFKFANLVNIDLLRSQLDQVRSLNNASSIGQQLLEPISNSVGRQYTSQPTHLPIFDFHDQQASTSILKRSNSSHSLSTNEYDDKVIRGLELMEDHFGTPAQFNELTNFQLFEDDWTQSESVSDKALGYLTKRLESMSKLPVSFSGLRLYDRGLEGTSKWPLHSIVSIMQRSLKDVKVSATSGARQAFQTVICQVFRRNPAYIDMESWQKQTRPDSSLHQHRSMLSKILETWGGGSKYYDPEICANVQEVVVNESERNIASQRFHRHFSHSQTLVASFYTYMVASVPIYGKLYLSREVLCYRGLFPGSRTKMVLPIGDIENVKKDTGFRFGYSGILLIIKGHEEIFFEFASASIRDDCKQIIMQAIELHRKAADTPFNKSQLSSEEALKLARQSAYEVMVQSELESPGLPAFILEPPTESALLNSKRYRFTFLTIGSRGDVQPYIALALRLKTEGHFVRIATHVEFKDWIEKYSIDFQQVAGDPSDLIKIMIDHGMISVSFMKDAAVKFRAWIDDLLKSAWQACEGTDILVESPSAMAGIHIAEALEIPYFRAFSMPWTRTRVYPHAFLVPERNMGGTYNYLTYVIFENVFWRGISSQVNRWRKNSLGLEPTNLDILKQSKLPFIYSVSPVVLVPPADAPSWVKVSGYWFLDEANPAANFLPSQELQEFIVHARKDHKKLVYIGFGSIVIDSPREMTKIVVDAVLQANVRCILSKGWSDRLDHSESSQCEIPLPPEVHQISSAPHDWLFPQLDAIVHHGGAGTTGASLRAGVPTVIRPFFGDQFFYAERVENLGVGVFLHKLTVNELANALQRVTSDPDLKRKAKSLGDQIRSENGTINAMQTIFQGLAYAKEQVLMRKETSKAEEVQSDESWTVVES